MGRQEFPLPLFWQAVNLDLNPLVKDFLVYHAYTTFFTRTFANFEALCEGRNIRIGRPWSMEYGEDESSIRHITDRMMNLVGQVVEAIGPVLRMLKSTDAHRSSLCRHHQ